jgi:hypothetical protein
VKLQICSQAHWRLRFVCVDRRRLRDHSAQSKKTIVLATVSKGRRVMMISKLRLRRAFISALKFDIAALAPRLLLLIASVIGSQALMIRTASSVTFPAIDINVRANLYDSTTNTTEHEYAPPPPDQLSVSAPCCGSTIPVGNATASVVLGPSPSASFTGTGSGGLLGTDYVNAGGSASLNLLFLCTGTDWAAPFRPGRN